MRQVAITEFRQQQTNLFRARYVEHCAAKADLIDLDAAGDMDDEKGDFERKHASFARRLEDAERLLMTTYAAEEDFILTKIEILEAALNSNAVSPFTDRRVLWMFAAIKADILAYMDAPSR